jgi:hypothetical protein
MGATATKRALAELCREYLALRAEGAQCYKDASEIMEEIREAGMESGDQAKVKGKNGETDAYALLDDWEGKNEVWVGRYASRFSIVKIE